MPRSFIPEASNSMGMYPLITLQPVQLLKNASNRPMTRA